MCKGLDSWEDQYLSGLDDKEVLAWTDDEAKERYSDYAYVYDKLWTGKNLTPLVTFDLEKEMPPNFPVFIKPRENMNGMSKGAYVASFEDEITVRKGMIAQQLATGPHLSTDYVIRDGKVIDFFTFLCHKNYYGSFYLFESIPVDDGIVRKKVQETLKGYTGVACVEAIGGNIIDFHLRPATQFFDICGGLIEQLPNFVKTGEWRQVPKEQTYSKVLRRGTDAYVTQLHEVNLANGIRSIQQCWTEGNKLSEEDQDNFSFRYAVINGSSISDINNFAEKFNKSLKFEE